jgi:hypothetical protein
LGSPRKGKAMLNIKAHLCDDCVHFVIQHGCGDVSTRDPHQAVPPDCGFVRGRYPGATLFTSAGIVTLRTRRGMSTPQLDDWCTIATFVAGMP